MKRAVWRVVALIGFGGLIAVGAASPAGATPNEEQFLSDLASAGIYAQQGNGRGLIMEGWEMCADLRNGSSRDAVVAWVVDQPAGINWDKASMIVGIAQRDLCT